MRLRWQMIALLMAMGLLAAACDGASAPEDISPSDTADQETTMAPETSAGSEAATALNTTAAPGTGIDQVALDDIARQIIADFELPGAVIQLRVDGQDPTTAVAGLADVDSQEVLADTDQLRIYSVTKAVTAVVVLQLAEEGVLALGDAVTDWLPDSVVGGVPHADQMTIRQLLNHSSGAADYLDTVRLGEELPAFVAELFAQAETGSWIWYAPQELIDFSTQFEPVFLPGEGTAYSNTGYVMLGLLVESATKNNLEDEMRSRVFEPLGLTSTYLETPTSPNDYAAGYQQVGGGQVVSVAGSNSSFAWSAGGIISNIYDFGRLADALYGGELLTPDSYTAMFTFAPGSIVEGVEYGMGAYRVETPWGPLELIEGGGPGYTASAFRFPERNATFVAIFNRNDASSAFQAAVERSLELLTP